MVDHQHMQVEFDKHVQVSQVVSLRFDLALGQAPQDANT